MFSASSSTIELKNSCVIQTEKIVYRQSREDMRKIHVTRQFLGVSGPQAHFFERTKKMFLDEVYIGVCVPNYRSVWFFVWPEGVTPIHKQINNGK